MKRLITILFSLLLLAGCASIRQMSESMRKVVTIEKDSLSKAAAYKKTLAWTSTSFQSADMNIKMKDPDQGTIIFSGQHEVHGDALTIPVTYTTTIDIRDQKVRFTQVIGNAVPKRYMITQQYAEQMHAFFKAQRADLLAYYNKKDMF